jgi:predicted outer membrane repeat protein
MRISRSCVIFTGNNIVSGNSAPHGGSLYIFESVVTLRGINTFMNNTSPRDNLHSRCLENNDWFRGSGGAICCRSSTLNINSEYSIFAYNSAQQDGGAINARDGNITIKGSVTFMANVAYERSGGAIFLYSVSLIVSGDISFINNEAYSGGALSILSGAKFLIVDEERMVNKKSVFNDAVEFCRSVSTNREMSNIEAKYVGLLNESGKGAVVFRGNMASFEGGGIKSFGDSDIIIFDGSIHFENNQAMDGGGMYLGDNSRLMLFSSIQNDVAFILNHAQRFGGALYIDDSQCSPLPKECFFSIIYGDNYSTAVIKLSLLFLNNSAGFRGSILYGGELNKCRLRFIAADVWSWMDECDIRADHDDGHNALLIFTIISRISESESASSIASQPEQM